MPSSRAAIGLVMRAALPSMAIPPESGWCTPDRIFTSVDLPAPFSPSKAVIEPRCNSRSTPASARTPPKVLRTPVSVKKGGTQSRSEYLGEFGHVAGVIDEWLAHRADSISPECHLSHAARGHRLVRGVTARQACGDLRSGVTEIDGVPDRELRYHALLNVAGELGRQAQAGHLDLARHALVFDGA